MNERRGAIEFTVIVQRQKATDQAQALISNFINGEIVNGKSLSDFSPKKQPEIKIKASQASIPLLLARQRQLRHALTVRNDLLGLQEEVRKGDVAEAVIGITQKEYDLALDAITTPIRPLVEKVKRDINQIAKPDFSSVFTVETQDGQRVVKFYDGSSVTGKRADMVDLLSTTSRRKTYSIEEIADYLNGNHNTLSIAAARQNLSNTRKLISLYDLEIYSDPAHDYAQGRVRGAYFLESTRKPEPEKPLKTKKELPHVHPTRLVALNLIIDDALSTPDEICEKLGNTRANRKHTKHQAVRALRRAVALIAGHQRADDLNPGEQIVLRKIGHFVRNHGLYTTKDMMTLVARRLEVTKRD